MMMLIQWKDERSRLWFVKSTHSPLMSLFWHGLKWAWHFNMSVKTGSTCNFGWQNVRLWGSPVNLSLKFTHTRRLSLNVSYRKYKYSACQPEVITYLRLTCTVSDYTVTLLHYVVHMCLSTLGVGLGPTFYYSKECCKTLTTAYTTDGAVLKFCWNFYLKIFTAMFLSVKNRPYLKGGSQVWNGKL